MDLPDYDQVLHFLSSIALKKNCDENFCELC